LPVRNTLDHPGVSTASILALCAKALDATKQHQKCIENSFQGYEQWKKLAK